MNEPEREQLRNPLMRQLIDSLRQIIPSREFEREIAPGVHVHVRKAQRSLTLMGASPFIGLGSRVHDAWDVLRGKAQATHDSPIAKLNGYRRAA
jgi:hypothetical protein